ncbi:MAG: hypothetical protein KBD90_00530 [Alphaproteobacteria bacterium]|nr:hypothetical protein [Alphaproteobacteria bacterium]
MFAQDVAFATLMFPKQQIRADKLIILRKLLSMFIFLMFLGTVTRKILFYRIHNLRKNMVNEANILDFYQADKSYHLRIISISRENEG